MYTDDNTCIVAPITGLASKDVAVAVIRISGIEALHICHKIFKGADILNCKSHTLHFGKIVYQGELIDEVLISVFKAPKSYTGQNIVEISCHASQFIINKIINILILLGARYALPGEFTKRAFLNGKLDLIKASSIQSLIASTNKFEHQAAMHAMQGEISKKFDNLRDRLITAKSLIEVEIDFDEEHNLGLNQLQNIKLVLSSICKDLQELVNGFTLTQKNFPEVVIVGAPNVGKSSLFNAILNNERSLISNTPGTTRDIVSERLEDNVDGIQFSINDTAGLRKAINKIEKLGIQKTMEKLKQAQIIVYVFDVTKDYKPTLPDFVLGNPNIKILYVASKSDTFNISTFAYKVKELENISFVSSKTGQGIQELKELILQALANNYTNNKSLLVSPRQKDILVCALHALSNIVHDLNKPSLNYDLLAYDLNEIISNVELLIGKVINDEYLDEIFSNFCVGK